MPGGLDEDLELLRRELRLRLREFDLAIVEGFDLRDSALRLRWSFRHD
jgi:hypothetical protein